MTFETSTGGLSRESRRDLADLFGRGERATTVEAAAAALGIERDEAAGRLAGWALRGWVRRVRRGLYIAVPVDAIDPASWTEDPWYLADLVWSPCYVTGWTAANHWSLTDQVFRTTSIATTQRVRRVEQSLAESEYVVHHVEAKKLDWGLRTEWRHDRRVRVADPARTVGELLVAPALGGGIRHVAEVVDTYFDTNETALLIEALERLETGAAFKRLGFLIEHLGINALDALERCRRAVTSGFADLDPSLPSTGPRSAEWNIRVNVQLER